MQRVTAPVVDGHLKRVLLTEDVAQRLGVSTKTVRAWAAAGLIPHNRPFGTRRLLFSLEELEQWERGESGDAA